MSEIRDQVRAFVIDNFYVARPESLHDEDSLLDHGVMDSTGVIEVIGFIERAFDVAVDEAEVVPENLDSIAAITAYVTRKRVAPAAA